MVCTLTAIACVASIVYNCAGIHGRNGSGKLGRCRGATLNRAVGGRIVYNSSSKEQKRNKYVYEKLDKELQKTGSDKSSVCKRNKSDGVVRDAIAD